MTYPTPKAVTFDCYGTLIQFYEGLQRLAETMVAEHKVPELTPERLLQLYGDIEHRIEQTPPHQPFRQVSAAAMREAFETLGLPLLDNEEFRLAEAIPGFDPFPEAPEVLTRLRKHCRLCIISNTDDVIIEGNVARLGVPIDLVVTAQQAGAYKPSLDIFRLAHERLGLGVDDIVHVAQSQRLDIQACKALGLRAIWINRYAEPDVPENQPYLALPDLRRVPETLGVS